MTCVEAIKIIEIARAEVEWNYPMDYAAAFDMAIAALRAQEEIDQEEYIDPVEPREGGLYSLYCKKCKCWVPNTANAEMRKEGIYAHCHICGIRRKDEIYEEAKMKYSEQLEQWENESYADGHGSDWPEKIAEGLKFYALGCEAEVAQPTFDGLMEYLKSLRLKT